MVNKKKGPKSPAFANFTAESMDIVNNVIHYSLTDSEG